MKSFKSFFVTCTVFVVVLCLLLSCRKTADIHAPADSTATVPPVIDTASTSVSPAGPGQVVIVDDLLWIFPWYNAVEVPDFYNKVPRSTPFNVYIKRGKTDEWIPVLQFKEGSPLDIKY